MKSKFVQGSNWKPYQKAELHHLKDLTEFNTIEIPKSDMTPYLVPTGKHTGQRNCTPTSFATSTTGKFENDS